MPHTDFGLPFANATTPLSRHTSRAGAESATERALPQLVRLIVALIDAPDGCTDHELAFRLQIPLASVCARRHPLRQAGLIRAEGMRPGPTGEKNAIWRWISK